MNNYKPGDLIIYQNGDSYQIGKIKRVEDSVAYVYYHRGDTASRTPLEFIHKIENSEYIVNTTLGEGRYDICMTCPYDCNSTQRDKMITKCTLYGQGGGPHAV